MKNLVFVLSLIIALAFTACPALAKGGYIFGDSGNTYSTQKGSSGSHTQGSNLNTGNTWNTDYHKGGNQSGVDSQGNQWDYNRSTGVYQNHGTGETRRHGQGW